MNFTQQYLSEAGQILQQLDTHAIDQLVALLAETRAHGGRLFILGAYRPAINRRASAHPLTMSLN